MERNSTQNGGSTATKSGRDEVDEHLRKVDEALEELDQLVGDDDPVPAKDEEGAAA